VKHGNFARLPVGTTADGGKVLNVPCPLCRRRGLWKLELSKKRLAVVHLVFNNGGRDACLFPEESLEKHLPPALAEEVLRLCATEAP
jgi:hypothetical protein